MKLLKQYGVLGMKIVSALALLAGIFFSAPSHALQIGDRVQANGIVNVRSSAAGSFLGTQASGNQGGIVGGPQTASLGGVSYTWWSVNWDAGVDGWVADIGLTPIAAAAPAAQSDLIPQNISLSSSTVSPGASLTVNWALANIGSGAANAGSTTVVRINQSTTSAAPVANLASVSTAALGAGASVGQSTTLTAPTTPGTYYVWVIADNYGAVSNQSNTNNDLQHSTAFTVSAPAANSDLVPQNITLSSTTIAPGTSLTANWTLANIGSGAANAASTTAVRINQSTTSAAGTNLASVSTAALGAGASVGQSATLTAPTTPGTYYVWVLADNYSAVTNQGTNTANDLQHSATFTVAATIVPQSVAPTISNVGPNPVTGSANQQTVTINGSGFVNKPTITLTWSGMPSYIVPAAQITYVSGSQLQMTITTTTSPDNWTVKVTNPDDQSSNTASFQVVAPAASTTTTSPDYGVWNDNYGCLTSNDSSYNNKLAQLAQSIFKLSAAPTVGTGCITEPYLADRYSSLLPGMENHAGIDFQAPPETPAYAIFGGKVTHETLDIQPDPHNSHSTLVIESTVGNQILRIFYLHCKSHNNQLNNRLVTGMQVSPGDTVCQTGSVGAGTVTHPAPHLHLEVKVKGMDGDNLSALAGSHCNSSFIAFDNSIKTGCNLGDIRARTVDPVILISPVTTITPPTISAFSVTPSSIALGSPLTISLTASDTGGSGLNRVEFKRSNGDGTANDPNWTTINTTPLSGNGPQTTTVSDQPTTAGTWWYGAWVYDNSGNRIDERAAGRGPLSVTVGTSSTPSDCLFNWAERTYPNLFAPAVAKSSTSAPYYYRYYSQTRAYLATSSDDNHLYYLGPISNNVIRDVGALPAWLTTANCH